MPKKSQSLDGYEVLLCVTGGIACYKSADLASKLVQAGAGVNVAMTASAQEFVRPLTFQSLVSRPVYTSMWQATESCRSGHIALTELADLVIVAPATANMIGKMSCGLADDLVSTMILATTGQCEVLIAPAMNTRMWEAPVVQENLRRLRRRGVYVLGPGEGRLACGAMGAGRMIEPAEILAAAQKLLLTRPPKSRATGK